MKTAVACMAAGVLLTGCSATKVEYVTLVEMNNFSAECNQNPYCWLPTQFEPAVVDGESITRPYVWPGKGDYVVVVCETTGEEVSDITGKTSDRWFGILVPEETTFEDIPVTNVMDGYLGYVSSLWLADKQVSAPDC